MRLKFLSSSAARIGSLKGIMHHSFMYDRLWTVLCCAVNVQTYARSWWNPPPVLKFWNFVRRFQQKNKNFVFSIKITHSSQQCGDLEFHSSAPKTQIDAFTIALSPSLTSNGCAKGHRNLRKDKTDTVSILRARQKYGGVHHRATNPRRLLIGAQWSRQTHILSQSITQKKLRSNSSQGSRG